MSWNETEALGPSSISVGELCPGLSAKLVDENGVEVVKPGVRGELWITGPNVMKGYWHNKQATEQTLTSDGWLKTGDIAYVDVNGKWYIVDRKKVSFFIYRFQVMLTLNRNSLRSVVLKSRQLSSKHF